MSHIGKKVIIIPNEVSLITTSTHISVSGKYGSLSQRILPNLQILIKDNELNLIKTDNPKISSNFYGLMRTLIANMIIGVTNKFSKTLVVEGVGYKFQVDKSLLILFMGFSYPIKFIIPAEIQIPSITSTKITLTSISKEKVGLFAAKIRAIRPPEPYKGKGIQYEGEVIKRKIGKKGK